MSTQPVFAITSGEPAGIGPELCVMLAQQKWPARIVVLADQQLLQQRAQQIGLPYNFAPYQPQQAQSTSKLEVLDVPLRVHSSTGILNVANSAYVIEMLDRASRGCMQKEFSAMVTAPVHKGIIADSGIEFSGHTEYLAATAGVDQVVMMLAGKHTIDGTSQWLRVALATTHLPLAQVPAAITIASLTRTLRIMHSELRGKFGLLNPHILVAGLNPHAGENGHLGREEIDVIEPVIHALRTEGMHIDGPLPADTLFVPQHLRDADAVLAMYHDQGLPVLKYATFGAGINITLGLPFLRTSVDHGTALDLAGTGRADPGSLYTALQAAFDICQIPS